MQCPLLTNIHSHPVMWPQFLSPHPLKCWRILIFTSLSSMWKWESGSTSPHLCMHLSLWPAGCNAFVCICVCVACTLWGSYVISVLLPGPVCWCVCYKVKVCFCVQHASLSGKDYGCMHISCAGAQASESYVSPIHTHTPHTDVGVWIIHFFMQDFSYLLFYSKAIFYKKSGLQWYAHAHTSARSLKTSPPELNHPYDKLNEKIFKRELMTWFTMSQGDIFLRINKKRNIYILNQRQR